MQPRVCALLSCRTPQWEAKTSLQDSSKPGTHPLRAGAVQILLYPWSLHDEKVQRGPESERTILLFRCRFCLRGWGLRKTMEFLSFRRLETESSDSVLQTGLFL